jgi:hypothetical protein
MYRRLIESRVREALADTPAVIINGPRQSGKTTLVRRLAGSHRRFLTLDDATTLEGARRDPVGFVRGLDRAVIDEIQRAPDLMLAIKRSIDEDRRPGRFLITGSANILTAPRIKESLAGRVEILPLYPLSRAEILGRKKPGFLTGAFAGKIPRPKEAVSGDQLVESILAGGYPEVLERRTERRRVAWCRAYIDAIVERDLPEIAQVDRIGQFAKLIHVLAEFSAQLVNFSQIGSHVGLDHSTTARYVALLEALFLIERIRPWHRNHLKRLVKTPKLHFLDSGLMAALRGQSLSRMRQQKVAFGPLLESFVFAELLKQASWAQERLSFFHYRDKDQLEVDIVVENEGGEIVGIEIKAAASVQNADFRGLQRLRAASGREFRLGVVLYDGAEVIRFGEFFVAAPIASLWS